MHSSFSLSGDTVWAPSAAWRIQGPVCIDATSNDGFCTGVCDAAGITVIRTVTKLNSHLSAMHLMHFSTKLMTEV